MSKDTKHPLAAALPEQNRIAYVRTVQARELSDETELPPGVERLYSVHDENGQRLAVFADRNAAFAVARDNDFSPVSVH